jgi:hypothetical protein
MADELLLTRPVTQGKVIVSRIANLLLSALLAIPLIAQAPGNACCELTAKVDVAQPDGSPATLKVVVKNVAADSVVVEWGTSDDILFAVLRADGQEAERTEYGRRMLTKERGGSARMRELGRDDSFEQAFDLAQVYRLSPGDYVVVVIRRVVVKDVQIPFSTKASFSIP